MTFGKEKTVGTEVRPGVAKELGTRGPLGVMEMSLDCM
jgi:hypothetical protein